MEGRGGGAAVSAFWSSFAGDGSGAAAALFFISIPVVES